MNRFLLIDCHHLEIVKEEGEISIRFKAELKLDLKGESKEQSVKLVNREVLKQKQARYTQLFKSKVVYPPVPEVVQQAELPVQQPIVEVN